MREEFGMTDKGIEKIVKDCDIDIEDFILERNEWFVLEDKMLSPGIYKLREEKLTKTFTETNSNDKIRVKKDSYPITTLFGLDIYEATHINTNQPMFITLGEIYK